jgi:thiol-disulfide isomerase/thioredoxin
MRRREVLPALAALPSLAPPAAGAAPVAPGEPVPWPTVSLLDGGHWGPAQAQGAAVVVVFWSLHCAFCLRHNQRLTRLADAIGERPLRVLTAVREPEPEATRQHLRRQGWRFPVTLEVAPLAAVLSTRRFSPLTVTVERSGRLRQVIPGEMADDDIMGLLELARG